MRGNISEQIRFIQGSADHVLTFDPFENCIYVEVFSISPCTRSFLYIAFMCIPRGTDMIGSYKIHLCAYPSPSHRVRHGHKVDRREDVSN